MSANPGRSGHKLSLACASIVYSARQQLMNYVNLNDGNVIFTKNCTEALNLAILGSVKKGGHVIASAFNHNSVLRPLNFLKELGLIELTIIYPNENMPFSTLIENSIRQNTYLVCINNVCNVSGLTFDLSEISQVTKKHNLLFLVDGAQSFGYMDIDMQKCGIDMLAIPCHKGLHAIQGLGVLFIKNSVRLSPIMFGGTGTKSESEIQPTDMPEGFESGTLNFPAISSVIPALNFLKKNKMEMRRNMDELFTILFDGLHSINNVNVFSYKNSSGIVSFNIKNRPSSLIADRLDSEFDIAVRGGLHCSPLVHKYFNTLDTGLIRASLSAFNKKEEVYTFLRVIDKIARE